MNGVPADARLAALQITVVELDQAFDPDVFAYDASVNFLTSRVAIVADPVDANATISIDGASATAGSPTNRDLSVGANAVEIEVVNGSARQQYSVAITRASPASFAELALLTSDPPRRELLVGTRLSGSGATVLASTPFDDGNASGVNAVPIDQSLRDSGAAFVFARDAGGAWVQEAYLKASNPDINDSFGHSAAIDGNTVVIGAPYESSSATEINGDENDDSAPGAGAAYVFVRGTDGTWTQQAYLKASDGLAGDTFGYGVTVHGDTVAVSARRMFDGTVYLFTRDANGTWTQETAVSAADGLQDIGFGDEMALAGETLAVAARWHYGAGPFRGAVYVYRRASLGVWAQEALVVSSNADDYDTFGESLALSGATLAVGALNEASAATGVGGDETDNSAPFSGAAYVFTRSESGDWTQQAYIKASNTESQDDFGYSLDLQGDWLVVGAENEGSAAAGVQGDQSDNSLLGSGAAYLYARDAAGTWSQQLYIKAAIPRFNVRFGRGFAFTTDGLAVAAPFADGSDATTLDSGAIHVFE